MNTSMEQSLASPSVRSRSRPKPRLSRLHTEHVKSKTFKEDELQEPMTPVGRMFSEEKLNCYIIAIITLGKSIEADIIKSGLSETLAKHKRFRSRIVRDPDTGSLRWSPCKVDIDKHVTIVDVTKNPEEYAEMLANAPPLDPARPLWQVHLLMNCSALVLRVHHSLGDGVSLMSLVLACARKADDPGALPAIPLQTRSKQMDSSGVLRRIWMFVLMVWYTFWDVLLVICTFLWLKDSETAIKGSTGVENGGVRIVYRTFPLSEAKAVKATCVNSTLNDVFIAMLSSGIYQYLQRKQDEKYPNNHKASLKKDLPKNLCLRSVILVNTRPSPGLHDMSEMMSSDKNTKAKWGNSLGYVILPFPIVKYQDPLDYMKATCTLTKKKNSLLKLLLHTLWGVYSFMLQE